MKRIIFILLFSMLLIQLVSSEEISGASFNIKIYNGTLEITNSDYSGNNKNFSFNNSGSNEFSYSFLFIKNTTVSVDLVDKYANCLAEKSACDLQSNSFNIAWNGCLKDLKDAGNISDVQGNLTTCQTSLTQKDTEIGSKQSAVDDCNKKQQEKSNQPIIVGVICFGLGILGTLIQQKKIKFGGVKDKAKDEYNPTQGG